jgi:hypothetical protein
MGFDQIGHPHDNLALRYTLKTTKKGYSEIPNKCFINSPAAKKAKLYYQAQAVAG